MTAPLARPAAFRGFRFPPDLITLTVRWYLRYNLSYWDLEEVLAERGVQVDHVTIHRWVLFHSALHRRCPGPPPPAL
jgi:transposase-like protein